MCSPSLLITCPYQFNLLSLIFLEACATLVVPRMCSFLILSLRVTPHIHRSILISVTSIRFLVSSLQPTFLPHISLQALTLGLWVQWPGGPVDLKTYWPPKKFTGPPKNWSSHRLAGKGQLLRIPGLQKITASTVIIIDCDVVGSSDRCVYKVPCTQYETNYKYYMDISIEDVFLAGCVRVTCAHIGWRRVYQRVRDWAIIGELLSAHYRAISN